MINKSIGFVLLAIYLICIGLSVFGVIVPAVLLGILALAAGILILIGR